MLNRSFLILAILASLGSAGVAYYQWSSQIPSLIQQRDAEKKAKAEAEAAHNLTKAELNNNLAALSQTKQAVAAAKSEQAKALARFDAQEKRTANLSDRLVKASGDLQDFQKRAAEYQASGLNPQEVAKLKSNLVAAQKQMLVVETERNREHLRYVLAEVRLEGSCTIGASDSIKLPSDLKGSIAVVDPKWDFAVINIGEDKGALVDGELLVSRSGQLVAKVLIRSVEKDHCIADVVPHWKFGEIIEGDVVTPAHPASLLVGLNLGRY